MINEPEESGRLSVDWLTIFIYAALVIFGWLNIYAAVYDPTTAAGLFDFSQNSGRQLIWMATSVVLTLLIMALHYRVFIQLSFIIYGAVILLLITVLGVGEEINGAKSWIRIGGFTLQPSELAKFATSLALASLLSVQGFSLKGTNSWAKIGLIIALPAGLILLQRDAGSALVFGSFFIMLYREGMSPALIIAAILGATLFFLTFFFDKFIILAGIVVIGLFVVWFFRKKRKKIIITGIMVVCASLVVFVSEVVFNKLPDHQQNRIRVLVNPDLDPLGMGWNVTQSKIAIGSGGIAGKGFLEGTQTKGGFVPEQFTDFIFCTIGEEHGWIGTLIVISLFVALLWRITVIAERQKLAFGRVYGYCVAGIIFFHFMINIGMTLGFFPVIGIPLPFFSYGGSSLWSFTILLFILLKIDAHRGQVLSRS